MAITIYGDSTSGNCLKAKFVCDYLKVPYHWIETSVLKKETRTAEFLAMNPVGQVPVILTEDGSPLAQSNAIMLYLAKGSGLIPSAPLDQALMLQWLFWEQYSHETAIAVRRFHKTELKKVESEIDPALMPKCEAALSVMQGHLAKRRYFVGERLTLADIGLVAYTRYAHEAGLDLRKWPSVREWVFRIESNLGLAPACPPDPSTA